VSAATGDASLRGRQTSASRMRRCRDRRRAGLRSINFDIREIEVERLVLRGSWPLMRAAIPTPSPSRWVRCWIGCWPKGWWIADSAQARHPT
jgi:hypothetical protein